MYEEVYSWYYTGKLMARAHSLEVLYQIIAEKDLMVVPNRYLLFAAFNSGMTEFKYAMGIYRICLESINEAALQD
jgi:hypothetical protein